MIYSASRRTDLVAFYPDFIVEKVRRSRKLDAIVFWTKDPRNLVQDRDLALTAERLPSIVQLTLTGLAGTEWEPRVPPPEELRESLKELSARLPAGSLMWRFDPIIPTDDITDRFKAMLDLLNDVSPTPVNEATISFVDAYKKVLRRTTARKIQLPYANPAAQRKILKRLREITGKDFTFHLCCEPDLLSEPQTVQARCIDGKRIDRLYGTKLGRLPKDGGQRAACGCMRSSDIGSYEQPCRHNCLYCYARPEMDG